MAGKTTASGRAYNHEAGTYDTTLALVGRGTKGGELLRRYWQPFALSSDATTRPKAVRFLGEDLILFRDKAGNPGLLYPRCVHRGTSLFYGRVEDDGIRCCYHGWKFDVEGRCIEQPCEPKNGEHRGSVRQPWYPVVEKYGALWTYMGPEDKQPVFPRFSIFEDLGEDEEIISYYLSPDGELAPWPQDYNWFQMFENAMDTWHLAILHTMISGPQFSKEATGTSRQTPALFNVGWERTRHGIIATSGAYDEVGREYVRQSEAFMPNCYAISPFFVAEGKGNELFWVMPFDDTNHEILMNRRQKKGTPLPDNRSIIAFGPHRKIWAELTDEEKQDFPSDYEAQKSQGDITLHSEEHLARSDKGVVMLRRLFKEQAEAVAAGRDPVGVAFRDEDALIPLHSGVIPVDGQTEAEGALEKV
jgi:phenylpropionate dioxygenase-like ring-hydroxylating dioxygenase large terminal subunit